MSRRVLALVILALLVPAVGTAGAASHGGTGPATRGACPVDGARIAALYPNPVYADDRGESVTVTLPRAARANWSIADGETVARFHAPAPGRVVLTTAPRYVRNRTSLPVVDLRGRLSLSNAGERVALRCDGRPVDAVAYGRVSESERWRRGRGWRPLGATNRSPVAVRDVPTTVFALPDAPGPPLAVVQNASRRIRLAGYTFTSRRVAAALRRAAARGVAVRVLVEGGPVGGVSRREARVLDRLVDAGVAVTVIDGPWTRYRFHHPKYAVVDDRVLVTSENWKPTSTGGGGTRGWGALVDSPRLARELGAVFDADAGWRDGVPWRTYRANQTFVDGNATPESYPTRFPARRVRAERVRLLLAPDDAEPELRALIASADESVLVEQVRIAPDQPLLAATVAAARRGVHVRVLLSGAWYVREENRALVDRLNRLAADEHLPLTARLVEPRSRFEHVHVKGLVVDGDHAVVGSLNWNNVSARANREALLVVSGSRAAGYYERVFRADWHGGAWRVPAGALAALLPAIVATGWLLRRRLSFRV